MILSKHNKFLQWIYFCKHVNHSVNMYNSFCKVSANSILALTFQYSVNWYLTLSLLSPPLHNFNGNGSILYIDPVKSLETCHCLQPDPWPGFITEFRNITQFRNIYVYRLLQLQSWLLLIPTQFWIKKRMFADLMTNYGMMSSNIAGDK